MKYVALLLLLSLLPLSLYARRDSTEVLVRASSFDDDAPHTVALFYDASAVTKLRRSKSSLTTLALRFDLRREEQAQLQPLGSDALEGGFRADSYLRLDDRSTVWGNARYVRGNRRGVRWNSTADYLLLYPYVLADSVGGDLSTEEYAFGGGYARRIGRVDLAIEGDYRAGQEYRQVDPRPHNKVSDFTLRAGAGIGIGDYTAGVDLSGRFYSQEQSVKFYDPRGNNAEEFYMLGLGSFFARYSGMSGTDNYLVDYDAKGYGFAAHLTPHEAQGWYVRVAYDQLTTDRMHRPNNHIPVSSLQTQQATAAAAYGGRRWSVRADAGYELRQGVEMIADRNGQGQIIDEQLMYTNKLWHAGAEASLEWHKGALRYTLLPSIGWWRSSASYRYPAREMTLSQLHGAVRAGVEWSDSRWRLKALAGVGVYCSPEATVSLPGIRQSIGSYLVYTADRLTDRAVAPTASFRAERRLNRRTACFVEAAWEPRFYESGLSQHTATMVCGLLF